MSLFNSAEVPDDSREHVSYFGRGLWRCKDGYLRDKNGGLHDVGPFDYYVRVPILKGKNGLIRVNFGEGTGSFPSNGLGEPMLEAPNCVATLADTNLPPRGRIFTDSLELHEMSWHAQIWPAAEGRDVGVTEGEVLCSGKWIAGSGGHREHESCGKIATWTHPDDIFAYCDEHINEFEKKDYNHERLAAVPLAVTRISDIQLLLDQTVFEFYAGGDKPFYQSNMAVMACWEPHAVHGRFELPEPMQLNRIEKRWVELKFITPAATALDLFLRMRCHRYRGVC